MIIPSKLLKELAGKEAKIIILAHQSRPGKLDCVSLKEHAKRMSEIKTKRENLSQISDNPVISFICD